MQKYLPLLLNFAHLCFFLLFLGLDRMFDDLLVCHSFHKRIGFDHLILNSNLIL